MGRMGAVSFIVKCCGKALMGKKKSSVLRGTLAGVEDANEKIK